MVEIELCGSAVDLRLFPSLPELVHTFRLIFRP